VIFSLLMQLAELFRVAKSGGVRNLLLMKAGVPEEWRSLNLDQYNCYTNEEILKDLRLKYQKESKA